MNTFAAQVFRSCTASLSSRTLARSTAISRYSPSSRRYYSDDSTSSQAGTVEKKENGENKAAPKDTGVQDTESKETESKGPELSEDQKRLKEKEQLVVDLTSRLRYLQADFLNLQRNAAREREQTRDFAITRFASDLLETVDVLSLALKSIPPSALSASEHSASSSSSSSTSPSSSDPPSLPSAPSMLAKSAEEHLRELHTGVEMTQRLLLQTLFKYHVKPFDPTGEKFDPNRHEALYQAAVPGKEPGTVLDCQKVGYTIKDRILRAAQVGVAQETS